MMNQAKKSKSSTPYLPKVTPQGIVNNTLVPFQLDVP